MNEYENFETWLNKQLGGTVPANVIAFNFNLYEKSDTEFDLQCIGSPEYDPDDSDWACNEIFSSGEDLCPLTAADWEACLEKAVEYLKKYLLSGQYAALLSGAKAVTVGFVDGDLEVVFQK